MKKSLIFFIGLFYSVLTVFSQQSISLLFVGDAMQHSTQFKAAKQADGTYDYKNCFKLIKEEVSSADLAFVNLETTLAGEPYSGYPCFSAPDAFAADLKDTGFNIFQTCNNHSADKGKKGINRTIDVLNKLRIKHFGTYKDSVEKTIFYPFMISQNGFRIAILNYTYDTNGMPVYAPNIVNEIDDDQILQDIEEAKRYNPDIIIACMHWGEEYHRLPGNEQRRLAKLLTDNGVRLVIGSHPHVIQPMEAYKNQNGEIEHLVVYSLGNFISNQNDRYTDSGAMVKIILEKNNNKVSIQECKYNLLWRYRFTENGRKNYMIVPSYIYDNNPEMVQPALRSRMQQAFDDARSLLQKHNKNVEEYSFEIEN